MIAGRPAVGEIEFGKIDHVAVIRPSEGTLAIFIYVTDDATLGKSHCLLPAGGEDHEIGDAGI